MYRANYYTPSLAASDGKIYPVRAYPKSPDFDTGFDTASPTPPD